MIFVVDESRFRVGEAYISITTPQKTIDRIAQAVKDGLNTYICVSNPRTVIYATKNKDYREVMANSFMNIPDAEPIPWAAVLWGVKGVERTMGPMLFHDMLAKPENGIRHFLLGDTDDTLAKITDKFRKEYGSNIVGTFSPPFCGLDEYDYESMANMINESGANIVWVSMRAPKQDFFAVRILPFLDKKICIGVGAAFRFNLGEYKMAPPIIKKLGLMGLYWGKKNQKFLPFLWAYLNDTVPYMFYLAQIPFKRILGKKYYK